MGRVQPPLDDLQGEPPLRTGREQYGVADIHIHSTYSDGTVDIPEILEYVQEETKLNVIAITDHDEIAGAYLARELATKDNYRFEVVVGMEVSTLDGHLLALFLESQVPKLQPLPETIGAVHAQGGMCIVPHPMCWLTRSISQNSLDEIALREDDDVYLDGIEVVNPAIASRMTNGRPKELNRDYYGLAETGSSDAHFLAQIGSGYTIFEGRTAADLRHSLLNRTTRAAGIKVDLQKIGYGRITKHLFKHTVVMPLLRLYQGFFA